MMKVIMFTLRYWSTVYITNNAMHKKINTPFIFTKTQGELIETQAWRHIHATFIHSFVAWPKSSSVAFALYGAMTYDLLGVVCYYDIHWLLRFVNKSNWTNDNKHCITVSAWLRVTYQKPYVTLTADITRRSWKITNYVMIQLFLSRNSSNFNQGVSKSWHTQNARSQLVWMFLFWDVMCFESCK